MRVNRSVPPCTVIPVLVYPDPAAAAEWLCGAFGFSVADELAKLGKDWRVVFNQLAREKKAAEKHELEFGADKSSKNQMNAASGTPSSTGDGPRSEDKEETTDE